MSEQEKTLRRLRDDFNGAISVLIVEAMEAETKGGLDEFGFYLKACEIYRDYQSKYAEACL